MCFCYRTGGLLGYFRKCRPQSLDPPDPQKHKFCGHLSRGFVKIQRCSHTLQGVYTIRPIGGFNRHASDDVSVFVNDAISLLIWIPFSKYDLNIGSNPDVRQC